MINEVMDADSAVRLWKAKMGVGRMAYSQGMYRQAARHFQAAMTIVREQDLDQSLLSITLVNLAKTLGSIAQFEEAETLLKMALQLDSQLDTSDDGIMIQLIEDFHQLSLLYWRAGKLTLAQEALDRAAELEKNQNETLPDELRAKLLKHRAVLAELSGDYAQCEKLVDRAIDFILGSVELGKYSSLYADCLMLKVVLLTDLDRYQEAIELYRRAIQIMEISRGDLHPKTIEHMELLAKLASRKGLTHVSTKLHEQIENMKDSWRKQGRF